MPVAVVVVFTSDVQNGSSSPAMFFETRFPKRDMKRRSFCNGMLIGSAGFALASRTQYEPAPGATVAYPPMKIEGAERLMPGSFLYFSYPSAKNPAVLVRASDGQYFAYGRRCGHRGCSVEFNPTRHCFVCPCHQGAYDLRTGFVLFGPPPRPLDLIVLQIRSGTEIWAVGRTIGDSGRDA